MPTPTVINRYQYSNAISRNVWDQNYQYENWETPFVTCAQTGLATSGTTTNVLSTRNLTLEFNPVGTQTVLVPSIISVAEGIPALDIQMTGTASLGVELCPGIVIENPLAFKMGYEAAVFARARFSIGTVAGAATCALGFRICDAYQAALATYSDFAAINVAAGEIDIVTNKTSGGAITTDTTQDWADGETHELKVLIDSTGVVSYQIDGKTPTVQPALPYQFTSTRYVVPFLMMIEAGAAAVTGPVPLLEWECGYQS
jgi:hypothetical protein